jgi:hypothetical protein
MTAGKSVMYGSLRPQIGSNANRNRIAAAAMAKAALYLLNGDSRIVRLETNLRVEGVRATPVWVLGFTPLAQYFSCHR